MKPVPIIYPIQNNTLATSSYPTVALPRKSPTKRVFMKDEYNEFPSKDQIEDFSVLNEKLSPPGYTYNRYENYVIYYKLELNDLSIPEVTEVIRIDVEMHVKLFFKNSPLPLPLWFRHGRDCTLRRKSMLANFPGYIKSQSSDCSEIFSELNEYKLMKKRIYSSK